ncbi:MAG: hypothetical protein MPK62_01625 [Alphaproteobacteria bacterium]|nr:hypothetical protein [Alphaproteobacteria bacterium]
MVHPVCRGICLRQRMVTKYPAEFYKDGRKFCTGCGVSFKWEGYYCPCCSFKLRMVSHYRNARILRRSDGDT